MTPPNCSESLHLESKNEHFAQLLDHTLAPGCAAIDAIGHSHIRLRRLRSSRTIRHMISDVHLSKSQFIYPLFITENNDPQSWVIANMPGVERVSFGLLQKEIDVLYQLGIHTVMLFSVTDPLLKTADGHEATNPDGLIPRSIKLIKQHNPQMCVLADVALDPYTTHGHDGILNAMGDVDNDGTVAILCRQAVALAKSGVDFVCPSDMMDGRIAAIRAALDKAGFVNVGLISYSAKYASALYGPFRSALQSGAKTLDKKTYQLDYTESQLGTREALLDEQEGADMVIVKPALFYADQLYRIKQACSVPVLAYQVSGEYSMMKAAAMAGFLDEKNLVLESFYGLKRAGADVIISYYIKQACLQGWIESL